MYLHKEGKIAEYKNIGRAGTCSRYQIKGTGSSGFPFDLVMYDSDKEPKRYETRDEALQAAMDYHETEGCALYLELYPAPEKGEWNWLAQDGDGCWYGYKSKPIAGHNSWTNQDLSSYRLICESPSNPFWRKTLR